MSKSSYGTFESVINEMKADLEKERLKARPDNEILRSILSSRILGMEEVLSDSLYSAAPDLRKALQGLVGAINRVADVTPDLSEGGPWAEMERAKTLAMLALAKSKGNKL